MKKMFLFVLVALLMVGLVTTSAFAATPADISGTVESTIGTPIAGAEVALIDAEAGAIVATTETDADGAFVFAATAEGAYMIAATAEGFEPATALVAGGSVTVELAPSPAAFGRGIAPTSATHGLLMVFVMDDEFEMITNATARFTVDDVERDDAEWRYMGWYDFMFQLAVVPGEAGTLEVRAPDFQRATIQVTAADFFGSFAMINVVLEPSIGVAVSVICTWNEEPIVGVTARLLPMGPPFNRDPISGVTNGYGIYIFDGVPAGMWVVAAEGDDFLQAPPPPPTVTITNPPVGDRIQEATVRLVPHVIRVQVLCMENLPIPNADVILWHNPSTGFVNAREGRTDANGIVRFTGLTAGTYFASAEANGYYPGTSPLYIVDCHNNSTLTVRLVSTNTIGPGGAPWELVNGTMFIRAGEICRIARPWYRAGVQVGGLNPWPTRQDEITRIVFLEPVTALTSLHGLFDDLSQVRWIEGLHHLNTSSVEDMSYLFSGMSSLASLDLSSWDTFNVANVTNMSHMFANASSLTNLILRCSTYWDTSQVTDMSFMFAGTSNLASLDLTGWATFNVQTMGGMFRDADSLRTLILWESLHFRLLPNAELPAVPNDATYTGFWRNVSPGTEDNPQGKHLLTSEQIMGEFYSIVADAHDTWVWQRR